LISQIYYVTKGRAVQESPNNIGLTAVDAGPEKRLYGPSPHYGYRKCNVEQPSVPYEQVQFRLLLLTLLQYLFKMPMEIKKDYRPGNPFLL